MHWLYTLLAFSVLPVSSYISFMGPFNVDLHLINLKKSKGLNTSISSCHVNHMELSFQNKNHRATKTKIATLISVEDTKQIFRILDNARLSTYVSDFSQLTARSIKQERKSLTSVRRLPSTSLRLRVTVVPWGL